MDILEKAFQLWVQRAKPKNSCSKVDFEYFKKYLENLCGLLNSGKVISVSCSRGYNGSMGNHYYFPEINIEFSQIDFFRDALKYSALMTFAIRSQIEVTSNDNHNAERVGRISVIQRYKQLTHFLDSEFVGFSEFQKLFFQAARVNYSDIWLEPWLTYFQLSSNESFAQPTIPDFLIKKNAQIPLLFKFFVPASPLNYENGGKALQDQSKLKSHQMKTEKKKKYSSPSSRVDLEKEKSNPVMHSFEKLETADQYDGGRRIDSGDDELGDHENALDEIDLNKKTANGSDVQSVFQSDSEFSSHCTQESGNFTQIAPSEYFYSEWNSKEKKYLKNFCCVIESKKTVDLLVKGKVRKLDYNDRKWKRRLDQILNKPLMVNRQLEGESLDIDQFIRDFPNFKKKIAQSGNWYQKNKRRRRDISIAILFDQSMSSDSWVKNKRVLDVIQDSLSRVSFLFKDVDIEIEVAGASSHTRKQINYEIFKMQNEDWRNFQSRIDQISPNGYTRLGPSIRHTIYRINKSVCRHKIIILITDGKPTDLDGYEGTYGIMDVKMAGLEAKKMGIDLFALAIDHESKKYFENMFFDFAVLIDPGKVSEEIVSKLIKIVA